MSLRGLKFVSLTCLVIGCAMAAVSPLLCAGEFNRTLSIGDAAPDWKDLAGVDEKKHSLAEFQDKEVLVIVFTCNSCPVAVDYEDRLLALSKQFVADGKCALIAINANKVADDLLPKMQERAKKKGFTFPYLHDESQQVAKAYGATYTPEFFVLNKDRKIVYMGAMDDSTDPAKVKQKHVEEAVAATLAGKKLAITETVARGCAVRYVRDRKKKT
jgi:peroxiredoxin